MKFTMFFLSLCMAVSFPVVLSAQSADQAEISADVAKLLASMTPEQREAVLKQAAKNQKKLESLSPEERQKLEDKTVNTAKTMDLDNVDPNKINVSRTRSVRGTEKDMDKYNRKYEAGKINNAVVKPYSAQP